MRKIIKVIIVLAAIGAAGFGIYKYAFNKQDTAKTDEVAYVTKVSELNTARNGSEVFNHYAGVVKTQAETKVNKNSDTKTILKVKEGDEVKAGDVLFSYDVEEYETKLEQAKIEQEKLKNELLTSQETAEQLKKDQEKAKQEDKDKFVIQIKEAELAVKEKELEIKSKKNEIKGLKKAKKNADVKSEVDGVVKSIKEDNEEIESYQDNEAYIVITQKGDYRIEGSVNEQNVDQLSEGTPVVVHARSGSGTWKGTISKIDTEKKQESGSEYYGEEESAGSTRYPFYVKLDSMEGLKLGQHVYMEVDNGQSQKTGLWLPEYCINIDDSTVWKEENEKLVKQKIELGEVDEENMEYEIKSGLSQEDYIAFPEELLKEGMKTKHEEDVMEDSGTEEELNDMNAPGDMEDFAADEFSDEYEDVEENTEPEEKEESIDIEYETEDANIDVEDNSSEPSDWYQLEEE